MESTFKRHHACCHIKCKHKFVHATKLDTLSAVDTAEIADANAVLSEDSAEIPMSSVKAPRTTRSGGGSQSSQISGSVFFL